MIDKKINFEEIRKIQIDELLYIKNLCNKYNINYFIISGTLLGAVKYKGYIPWDNDIDIALLRQDYLKLIDIIEKDNNLNYEVLTIYNTKDYYYPYAKLVDKRTKLIDNAKDISKMGVFIDIFPMDYFNDDICLLFNKTNFIRNMVSKRMKIKNQLTKTKLCEEKEIKVNFRILKRIIYDLVDVLSRPLGYRFWVKILDKITSKNRNGKYLAFLYINKLYYFDVELFREKANYIFENNLFSSIKNYDYYLKELYGDYMRELPLSKQRTNHQFEVYWR